jgi:hypothetical protein
MYLTGSPTLLHELDVSSGIMSDAGMWQRVQFLRTKWNAL